VTAGRSLRAAELRIRRCQETAPQQLDREAEPPFSLPRRAFVSVGCTRGIFSSSDESIARTFYNRGVSLSVVQGALILCACGKYISWLNNGTSEPIGSLHYFEFLVKEVQQRPFPPG
jgi:hypothetical protein